ncbi:hypothetical protein MIR68_011715 [Amoeboaphelidium protococcarum]|nr:hypothetical protein MIR68_011715 [Amoeboaphelidium protococcarum]
MKAIALYDFSGDKSNEEISFLAGDYIEVLNDGGDDGWWHGKTADGQVGIFPRLYVEKLDAVTDHDDFHSARDESPQQLPYNEKPPTPPMTTRDALEKQKAVGQLQVDDSNARLNVTSNEEAAGAALDRTGSSASAWASQLADRLRTMTMQNEQMQNARDNISSQQLIGNSSPQMSTFPVETPAPPLPLVPNTLTTPSGYNRLGRISSDNFAREAEGAIFGGSSTYITSPQHSRTGTLRGAPISSSELFSQGHPADALTSIQSGGTPDSLGSPEQTVVSSRQVTDVSAAGTGLRQNKLPSKSFNRFGFFVSSGVEDYLLKEISLIPDVSVKHYFMESVSDGDDASYKWEYAPYATKFDVFVTGHLVKTGLLSSQVWFQMHEKTTDSHFCRKLKHFEWLHAQLEKEFPLLAIYPMPDCEFSHHGSKAYDLVHNKNVLQSQFAGGKTGNSYLELQRRSLQRYIRKIASHPVLSQSEAFKFFVTCSSDQEYKVGRKRIEKILSMKNLGEKFFDKVHVSNQNETLRAMNNIENMKVSMLAYQNYVQEFQMKTALLLDSIEQLRQCSSLIFSLSPAIKNLNVRLSMSLIRLVGASQLEDGWCWHGKQCQQCSSINQEFPQISRKVAELGVSQNQSVNNAHIPIIEESYELSQYIDRLSKLVEVHQKLTSRLQACLKNTEKKNLEVSAMEHLFKRAKLIHGVVSAEMELLHVQVVEDLQRLTRNLSTEIAHHHKSMSEKFNGISDIQQ